MRLALLTFAILLAACGGSSKPAAEPTPEPIVNEAPPEPEPEPAPGGVSTGLPACDVYIEKMEAYLRCDQITQEVRDAAHQGLDAMKQGWGDTSQLPPDVRQQTEDACRAGVDALLQGAASLGCAI